MTCVLYDQIMCTDVDSDYSLITDDHDATCYKQLTCVPEPVYASSITYAPSAISNHNETHSTDSCLSQAEGRREADANAHSVNICCID